MELRQLRYLVALADEGSFTQAAKTASVAQPALSRQIQKLEAELGLPLVDRTTRRVALTPAGADVVASARRTLGELEALRHSLHRTQQLLQGRVTVGVTQTLGPLDIAAALGAFGRQHPGVELIVREALSVSLASQLREDRIDLALISGISRRDHDQLMLHRCRSERLVALVAGDHRLATRRQITIADLREQRFVSFPPGATIRAAIDRAAKRAGFTPLATLETASVSRSVALVAEGLGVAILPESDARTAGRDTVAVALRAPSLRYEIFLAWRPRRQLSPAAAALKALIIKESVTGG
jgi:LysR family transcriptional activator of glutamate synthase operon